MDQSKIKNFQSKATKRAYRSAIPKNAREQVTEKHPNGNKASAEYIVSGKIVGYRNFHDNGAIESERPIKGGKIHGTEYRWDIPGELLSAEPYVHGLPHGIARQWNSDGTLIGSYSMRHGTGIDLWWWSKNKLSEVRYLKDGFPHGYEWWIWEQRLNQINLSEERLWYKGQPCIERQWNIQGRISRGFPKHYVSGQRVTKAQYLRACKEDPTLPKFKKSDNKPKRNLPTDIQTKIVKFRSIQESSRHGKD